MEKDIDKIKNDFCINLSFSAALKTVQLEYEFQCDKGGLKPTNNLIDEEEEEFSPPGKDVYATMSMKTIKDKNEGMPILYEEGSMVSLHDKLGKKLYL